MGAAGLPLDSVLRQHQGVERLHRCHLLLADRFLYGVVRTAAFQEAPFWLGAALLADNGGGRVVHLLP